MAEISAEDRSGSKEEARAPVYRGVRIVVLILALGGIAAAAHAADRAGAKSASDDYEEWRPLGLESYEPSAFGYTKNNDDASFENIKISVKFPIMPKATRRHWRKGNHVFFSFTGYWALYIWTRHSGPVVGKEYNPQLFFQHEFSCRGALESSYAPQPTYGGSERDNCYVGAGYDHDSNGQIIDSPGQYHETQREQGTEAADDAISRGWDYIRLMGRYVVPVPGQHPYEISIYPTIKYFLADGLLQRHQEELHYWENPPDGKPRREVDGVSVLAKYRRLFGGRDTKIVLGYTTGYKDPFSFSTVRVEVGVVLFELPIVFWAQKGYMSDLSQYYRNVTGYGAEVEIGAF